MHRPRVGDVQAGQDGPPRQQKTPGMVGYSAAHSASLTQDPHSVSDCFPQRVWPAMEETQMHCPPPQIAPVMLLQ
jgi:hypothetical protein